MDKQVRITRVQFNKFKTFPNFGVSLDTTTILVGPNNSGKSTIIGAFRALSIALRTARSRPPERIELEEKRVLGYWVPAEMLPISLKNVHTDYDDVDSSVVFTLSNKNTLKLCFPAIGGCALVMNAQGVPVTSVAQFKKTFPITLSVVPVLGPVEEGEVLREKSTVMAGLNTHRASRHFRSYWHHFGDEFDEFSSLVARTWPRMEIKRPEFADHMTRELSMFCLDDRMTRELYWVGFGFQIWCQLLTHLFRSRETTLIVVDEPEIYLHPDVQRQLLGIIRDMGPDILLATHSTEIMAEADPSEIVLVDKKKNAGQRLRDVEGVQRALDAIGSIQNVTLSALAKNRRVLFVEGDEDFRTIRRFAKKLGHIELSTGVGITPLESGGFGSWNRVSTLASGIADALGSTLVIGAIYDRDFFCDEQINEVMNNLKKALSFAHVLERKEMENYLLVPKAIERAVEKAMRDRSLRSDNDSALIPNVHDCLKIITDDMRDEVLGQIVAKRVDYLRHTGQDAAKIASDSLRGLSNSWNSLEDRIRVVPGKEVLRRLREDIQERCGVTLTTSRIIDAMKRDEVPSDLAYLVAQLDSFRSIAASTK